MITIKPNSTELINIHYVYQGLIIDQVNDLLRECNYLEVILLHVNINTGVRITVIPIISCLSPLATDSGLSTSQTLITYLQ